MKKNTFSIEVLAVSLLLSLALFAGSISTGASDYEGDDWHGDAHSAYYTFNDDGKTVSFNVQAFAIGYAQSSAYGFKTDNVYNPSWTQVASIFNDGTTGQLFQRNGSAYIPTNGAAEVYAWAWVMYGYSGYASACAYASW